jgi:protein SCO1/2
MVGLWAAAPVRSDRLESAPGDLEGVGVTEQVGARLPLHLEFTNHENRRVRLGDLFRDAKPVILTLNYSNCPMLCNLQLSGLLDALRGLEWSAGREFDVVTVSIDPLETTARSQATRQRYLGEYDRPGASRGWHFLTGNQAAIRDLARAVGFGYRYLPERKEYAHAAVLILCSPEGRVCRYLYGVKYDSSTLRLLLVEASQGQTGSSLDQLLLYCFHYDATKGRYALTAMSIMRLGALLTFLVLAFLLGRTWLRAYRARPVTEGGRP